MDIVSDKKTVLISLQISIGALASNVHGQQEHFESNLFSEQQV